MSMHFDFSFQYRGNPDRRKGTEPFRMLILGDFSGHGAIGPAPDSETPARPILTVDVDNFDGILARVAPAIAGASTESGLRFRRLDDFHPDQLRSDAPEIRQLMQLRGSLEDPATAPQVLTLLGMDHEEQPREEAPGAATESSAATIERLLGRPPAPKQGSGLAMVDEWVRRAVEPHVQPPPPGDRAGLATKLHRALTDAMRRRLQGPAFRELEALWRATWWLVSGLETSETLRVQIIDLSKEELARDLAAGNTGPQTCVLGRTLTRHGLGQPGAENWALVVGAFAFEARLEDLKLLALLGATATAAGAAFIAAADESLLGCPSIAQTPDPAQWVPQDKRFDDAWQALRGSPIARAIGLALPRLLLRLPYGETTDPIASFPFEEVSNPGDPGQLLWGSPAIGCALLLGQAFQEQGWDMDPDAHAELEDLPAYTYRNEGESRLTPVAEHYLNDRQAEAILRQGIMPFVSHRQYPMARLLRFQSIADPPTPLIAPGG